MKDFIDFIISIWNSATFWKLTTLITTLWAIYQTNVSIKKAYTKKAVVKINYIAIAPMGQEAIGVKVVNDGNVDIKVNALGMTDKKSGKNAFIPVNSDVLQNSILPKKLSTGDDAQQAIAIQPLLKSIEHVMNLSCIYGFADLSTGERIYSDEPININNFLGK